MLVASQAWAATPSLTVRIASGLAGTAVNLDVDFDPGATSVTGIQFDLTLPAGLSTGTVTAGAIVTSANKDIATNLIGSNTWRFIVVSFSSQATLNQKPIGSGTLLTAQMMIAPGAAGGALNVPVSGVVYSDPSGQPVPVTLAPASGASVRVFPNPWRSDKHSGAPMTFDHLPLGSMVKLFTVSGHLVKTLTSAADTVTWDLTNDSGDKVASGLYLYAITGGEGGSGQVTRGKLAIIK